MSSEIKNRLEICNIEKKFKKNEVLKKLSCTLESGVYAILAPNGVGKTTLMRCIADIYTYNGEILFNGKNIKKQKIKIGYLPQQFGLFPELTVYQMMEYFCNLKKISKKDRKAAIDSCLKQVNLYDKKDEKNRKLSGGMVRRVGIAQAILGEPDVILLDEPTAGLDPEERMRFKNIINNLTKCCSHWNFNKTCILNCSGQGEGLGSRASLCSDGVEPVSTLYDNLRNICVSLNVI